jgi:hypothetical protein
MYNITQTGSSPVLLVKQTKMSFSFIYKGREQEGKIGPGEGVQEVGTSGRGEEVGKGHGRVNMVQILCTHVCKWKNTC